MSRSFVIVGLAAMLAAVSAAPAAAVIGGGRLMLGAGMAFPKADESFVNDGNAFFLIYETSKTSDRIESFRFGGSFAALSSDTHTYTDGVDIFSLKAEYDLITLTASWLKYDYKDKDKDRGVYYGVSLGYVEAEPKVTRWIEGVGSASETSSKSNSYLMAPIIGYSFNDKYYLEATYHYYFDLPLFSEFDPMPAWDNTLYIYALLPLN